MTAINLQRLHVGPRLSETAIHNSVVYLAGQIAQDTDRDMVGQTEEVLAQIDRLLAEAQSDKTLILQAMIFVSDMALFPLMNKAWDNWVVPGHTPPRATVEAKLAKPECLVEIKVIAAQKV